MKVSEMSEKDLISLAQGRQLFGNIQYGDKDKTRDLSKDLIEECVDIINISNLRAKRLDELGYNQEIIDVYDFFKNSLKKLCLQQFKVIKEIDKLMQRIGYKTEDVQRIWFDSEK